MRKLFILTLLLFLTSCASASAGSTSLKLGGRTSGNKNCFVQEIVELNYLPDSYQYNIDKNQTIIEIKYNLYSYFDSIKSLGGFFSYSVKTDGNSTSVQSTSEFPTSIAPNEHELVSLVFVCFKDWKTATVTYSDMNTGDKYSFSVKSEDYSYPINNIYPTLSVGDTCSNESNELDIKLVAFEKTTVGSAWVKDNEDNVSLRLELTSKVDTTIAIPGVSEYSIKADNGFSTCHESIASPSLPNSIAAKGIRNIEWILNIENTWNVLTVRILGLIFNINNPFK